MIQLVAPWLKAKQLVRLRSLEDVSLYDSILTCLYCRYRFLQDYDKRMFIEAFLNELDELLEDQRPVDVICYYFEINICVVTATPDETKCINYHRCVYVNRPVIIIEENQDRYYPVGVRNPRCGVQVVFYQDDQDDQDIITHIADKNRLEVPKMDFQQPIGDFNAKDMFKEYRSQNA